jgi:hypothetical protein
MRKILSDDDRKALQYLVKHGESQTFRIAHHVGYRYEDMATTHNRNRLKRLERWGYVASDHRFCVNAIWWAITEEGRAAIA